MSIRKTLNQNPAITTVIVLALLAIAIAIVVSYAFRGRGQGMPKSAFYSTDDGATTFVDAADKLVPFDHNGAQAVRAYKYKCGNGPEMIAFLERWSPEAKKAIEAAPKGVEPDQKLHRLMMLGRELRNPKDPHGKWINMTDPRYFDMQTPRCPNQQTPEWVLPE